MAAGRNGGPSELDHGGDPWTPAKPPHLLPTQDTPQGEPFYANLELQTRALQGDPAQPTQEEVEYSTVVRVRAWGGGRSWALRPWGVAAGREGSEGLAW